MFEGFEHKSFSRDGVEIAYLKGGSGPPLLLLHGFPQSRAMWARIAPELAKSHTVIAADLRGYGDSAKPAPLPDCANYTFREMALDNLMLMQQEGFARFHMIGHDRGARTGHRLSLDHADAVITLTVMDIVPTHAMFMDTNHKVAGTYWHWYFLSQPSPFPERLIMNDPDFFYETCLFGWGATSVSDFDQELLAEYRRCWREEGMIYGSCADYRAAASLDLAHDTADIEKQLTSPVLNLYGRDGTMAAHFDMPAEWQKRCENLTSKAIPGGHFFVDTAPEATTAAILAHLAENQSLES